MVGCTQTTTKPQEKTTLLNSIIEEPEVINMNTNSEVISLNRKIITMKELAEHNTEGNCWVVYENKVYDYNTVIKHPNMPKAFWQHCGTTTFEEAAKSRHSLSNPDRVENYGPLIGEFI